MLNIGPFKPNRRWLRIGVTLAILIIVGTAVISSRLLLHRQPPVSTVFPAPIARAINGFTPYYFRPTFQTNFHLLPSTVSYNSGVLLFSLKNPAGQSLIITEEATPSAYDTSQLSADKQFQTGYGHGYITDGATRTTGALFTSDGTWIFANAPDPIGADLMQQFLQALAPYKP